MSERLRKPAGMFNAAKCVQYLRWIGVDVTDEQARSWRDMERVHRFLGSTRRTAREGARMMCRKGHRWTGIFYRRGSGRKGQDAHNKEAGTCPECGGPATFLHYDWHEARDGSLHDCRDKAERWKSLEDYCHTREVSP